MVFDTLQLGGLLTNCYIVSCTPPDALVIDAGGSADVLIAYHTGTQDRQQYDTYGYGAGGWWGGYWGGGMTTTSVRTYTEGTLILDVVDRENNELVWRGSASKTIDEMESPEQRVKTVQSAVAKLLKDFPPS